MNISSQLGKLPPVPDDKTAVAMFTAHRINDISNELAHAEERMQAMRKTAGDLRKYHTLHFDAHLRSAMDQACLLKDSMLAHYPAEAAEWKSLNQVMDLASGYTLNKRSGMISLDLPPGTIAQVPGGVDDHHVTVVYLGPDVDDEAYAEACRRAQEAASAMPGPLSGTVGGIGTFKPSGGSDGKTVAWAGGVLPGAERIRSSLEDLSASEHKDWKIHITLAYMDPGEALPDPVPPTPVTFTHLSVHRGKDVMRYPLGGGPVEMSVAVNPAAKAASFAHLLQTIMYDGAHAQRHSTAMLTDTDDKSWQFDADHAEKHMKGAHEHTRKLSEHIVDNYPAEAKWLKELAKKEELSNISRQAVELGSWHDAWMTEQRGAHGQWVRGAESVPHVQGGSVDYQEPPHSRLINPRSPMPDPADHPFFKAHPMKAENVLHAYSMATEGQKAQGMRWYADAGLVAGAIAHGDQHMGAGLLSAYSPQTSWPVNMFNAARSVELGRPLGPHEGATVMQSHANAAKKIMDGKSFEEALPAPKTNAFARLIENKGQDRPDDPYGEVVIDRHALSVAAGERLGKESTPIGDDRYYQVVADEYRKAAIEASRREGRTISPSQMQAITWLVQQSANEAEDAANMKSGFAKGRATTTANAWKKWIAYAKQNNIDTASGTTALSMLYDPDDALELAAWEHQLRDSRGRWATAGGAMAGHVHPEGFSLDPHTGKSPSGGYMVALPGHTHQYPDAVMQDKHQLAAVIDRFLMDEQGAFDHPGVHLGGWVSDGKLWLDPSENITDRREAVLAGRSRNQVAIWDVAGGQEIGTEGTGGAVTEHSAPSFSEYPAWLRGYAGISAQSRGAAAGGGIAEQASRIDLARR